MAHTPGPWWLEDTGIALIVWPEVPDSQALPNAIVCIEYDDGTPCPSEIEDRENMQLIAATPDLLAVCEAVAARPVEVKEIMEREGFVIDNLDDRWQKLAFTLYTKLATNAERAEAAIAKATPDARH